MKSNIKFKRTRFDVFFDTIIVIISIFLTIVMLYPIYFIMVASISSSLAVSSGQTWLFPKNITLIGYQKVFEDARIWIGYRNTIFYTLSGTLFSLFATLTAGYALAQKELPFRKIIMFIFTFTMFFNGGLIPTYIIISKLGLRNNPLVMIVPFAVNVYNLILARTFFATSIPKELTEAARLDGCSYTKFFIVIVLPLSKAIIAVLGLYYAVGYWNEFFRGLIYISDDNLIPLQLVLREILISNQAFEDTASMSAMEEQRIADVMKYSLILISTIPVMCIYPFIQKYFTKGVMLGSLKG